LNLSRVKTTAIIEIMRKVMAKMVGRHRLWVIMGSERLET
jgi:hypothetical protein